MVFWIRAFAGSGSEFSLQLRIHVLKLVPLRYVTVQYVTVYRYYVMLQYRPGMLGYVTFSVVDPDPDPAF